MVDILERDRLRGRLRDYTTDAMNDLTRQGEVLWTGAGSGRLRAFLNKFGVWFLRRPDGPIDMLDVFSGEVERIADSYDALVANVNEQAWQELYLLSKLVYQLHQAGKIPGPGECYAVAPPAAFGGPNPMAGDDVDLSRVSVMAMSVWQFIRAQSVRGTAGA